MRWTWWWTVVGLFAASACGGSSVRSGANRDGSDGGTSAGTAGEAGVSAGGSTSGSGPGGSAGNGAGGSAGSGANGRGGTSPGGRGGTAGTNTGGQGADAGAGGEPACDLPGGITCSFDDACDVLGCGEPWSRHDGRLCVRDNCFESGDCPAGERCVPAPVAGRFSDPCGNQADSCEPGASGCECLYIEECFPSAACLPLDEFPPERDCAVEGLDCAELEQATATLAGYLSGSPFFIIDDYAPAPSVLESIQACSEKTWARFQAECD